MKKISTFFRSGLVSLGVVIFPLHQPEVWKGISFSGKKLNTFEFRNKTLDISVDDSSSAIVFPLPTPQTVAEVRVKGMINSFPKLTGNEGDRASDDFALRLALVYSGNRSLSFFERLFSPDWLKTISELHPLQGFGDIEFYVVSQTRTTGTRRVIPLGDGFDETVAIKLEQPGSLNLKINPKPNQKILGLWVQSDGDDGHSQFSVHLDDISIE